MQYKASGKVIASKLRRLAAAMDNYDVLPLPVPGKYIEEEAQPGAAAMLMFVRDLFTCSQKETFTRDEILILLNNIQNDQELFCCDLIFLMEQED